MKASIFVLMFLLSVGLVSACHTTVNVEVDAVVEGLTLDVYCGDDYVKSIVVNDLSETTTFKIGNHECKAEFITGKLKYNGEEFDSDSDNLVYTWGNPRRGGNNEADLSFTGVTEVPEFTTIGAALAMLGSGIAYKFKKKRI